MNLPRIFRTSTFALSLAYAGWFLLSSGALFYFIHREVAESMDEQVEELLEGDIKDVKEERDELMAGLTDTFLWGAGVSILLAVAGGWLTSTAFLRRVERINRTTGRIIEGALHERIEVRGSGDELDRLAERLNTMLDRLQALVESLRQVSSDIAHDLRTPLTRLRQSLESGENERALAECDQILATFSALLRIAQIEAGTRRAGFKPVDLSALFETIAETYGPVAEDAEHLFSAEISPNIHITGDPQLLTQLLANLVENAIKHTPAGTTIRLHLIERPGGSFEGSVRDDGPGIPSDDRERVFDRFVRLETSRTTPGSGLGLSLARAIAELHGFTLELSDASHRDPARQSRSSQGPRVDRGPGNIARIFPVLKDRLTT